MPHVFLPILIWIVSGSCLIAPDGPMSIRYAGMCCLDSEIASAYAASWTGCGASEQWPTAISFTEASSPILIPCGGCQIPWPGAAIQSTCAHPAKSHTWRTVPAASRNSFSRLLMQSTYRNEPCSLSESAIARACSCVKVLGARNLANSNVTSAVCAGEFIVRSTAQFRLVPAIHPAKQHLTNDTERNYSVGQ